MLYNEISIDVPINWNDNIGEVGMSLMVIKWNINTRLDVMNFLFNWSINIGLGWNAIDDD